MMRWSCCVAGMWWCSAEQKESESAPSFPSSSPVLCPRITQGPYTTGSKIKGKFWQHLQRSSISVLLTIWLQCCDWFILCPQFHPRYYIQHLFFLTSRAAVQTITNTHTDDRVTHYVGVDLKASTLVLIRTYGSWLELLSVKEPNHEASKPEKKSRWGIIETPTGVLFGWNTPLKDHTEAYCEAFSLEVQPGGITRPRDKTEENKTAKIWQDREGEKEES